MEFVYSYYTLYGNVFVFKRRDDTTREFEADHGIHPRFVKGEKYTVDEILNSTNPDRYRPSVGMFYYDPDGGDDCG